MKPLAALLALVPLLPAQDYRAKVQGLITDSSQAIVPGARVTLRNDNTGVETARATDSNGRYFFDFVEPGTYTLAVEQAGFARFVQQNILVQVRAEAQPRRRQHHRRE